MRRSSWGYMIIGGRVASLSTMGGGLGVHIPSPDSSEGVLDLLTNAFEGWIPMVVVANLSLKNGRHYIFDSIWREQPLLLMSRFDI